MANKLSPPIRSHSPPGADDKVVAVITGANSPTGIGRAAARRMAETGRLRALYICDRDGEHLDAQAEELASLPGSGSVDVHVRRFDAADEDGVRAVVGDAMGRYGRLDVFVANAGVTGRYRAFTDVSCDEFMAVMRVNALSVFLAAKHAAPAMRKTSTEKARPGGSIVATASVAGLRANAGPTAYSASKAAVVSMAQTMAYQLVGSGVRINAVCPGLIQTGMTAPLWDAARARGTQGKIGQLNPMLRAGQADEVARVVVFLAVWPCMGTLAHPKSAEETKAALEIRSIVTVHSRNEIEKCANSPGATALKNRAVSPLVRRADKKALEKWSAVSHGVSFRQGLATPKEVLFASNFTNTLTPETIIGPYFVEDERIRHDIREGQPGIRTKLDFQFIDIHTCKPIPHLIIDVWHANATGVYSGVTGAGQGGLATTFGRGVQVTDGDGVVQFDTVFPGHYVGRASHFHVMSTDGSGGTARHIGQTYMDDALVKAVRALPPYSSNRQAWTPNAEDEFAADEATPEYDPFMKYVYLGESLDDGLLMWTTIGIDPKADYSRHRSAAARWRPEGAIDLTAKPSGPEHKAKFVSNEGKPNKAGKEARPDEKAKAGEKPKTEEKTVKDEQKSNKEEKPKTAETAKKTEEKPKTEETAKKTEEKPKAGEKAKEEEEGKKKPKAEEKAKKEEEKPKTEEKTVKP
ncbi:hypothetical protein L249_7164 [Ophiocordyceps polyrhachis-furcata BCC 54312]|uniref:Intradiol ring-cleavage dioxygenases domain-containing protein n=1 Tax=Ophiocordyceps polyrhachis-furcata BCC 54312 TaxID=1330021 RepID=A0A367LAX2_9HYPO|nr:hypothetical protein L249_7164 [Ophiocordyceps polyrhachis-furcata BCC 54312]